MHVPLCLHAWMCVCACVCVLAIVVHGNVPPWLYMHVFFAVGFPKERAFGTLVPRWTHPKTRYSMRSLKSQPNIKMQHIQRTTPAIKAGKILHGQKPRGWKPHLSVCLSFFPWIVSPNATKFVSPSKGWLEWCHMLFEALRLQLTPNRDKTDFPPDTLWHVSS